MKRLLFVMHSMDIGGAERSLVNMLCELPEDRYEVDVLLFRREGAFLSQLPRWIRVLDTPETLLGLYGSVRRAGRYGVTKVMGTLCAKAARKTKKARKAWRWKHFYSGKIGMLPGRYDAAVAYVGAEIMYYVAEKVTANKKIVFIHNDYRTAGYSAADDAPYFSQMDAIVSISKQCVQVLKEEFPKEADRIHYLENITSSELVRTRAAEFTPEEYKPDALNILSVGRLWKQKGFDLAIDAAAELRDRGIDFRWYVVGEGSLRNSLQKQIDEKGLSDRFILLGSRNNPYPYMKNCDLLVQSSRYEGKSVVLDEAKMLHSLIVSTAYPTVGDQILEGKEGIVVEMSARGIADGIMRLLDNKSIKEEIICYLSQHEYGNQAEIAAYMKLFDE